MRKFMLFVVTVLLALSSVCSASMGLSEAKLNGVGLKNTLGEVVAAFGAPSEVKVNDYGYIKIVRYRYGTGLIFSARTGRRNNQPARELKVASFTVTNGSIATASGFAVGMSYQTVVAKYGYGEKLRKEDGMDVYDYGIGPAACLTFYVDGSGIIRKIYAGTEV